MDGGARRGRQGGGIWVEPSGLLGKAECGKGPHPTGVCCSPCCTYNDRMYSLGPAPLHAATWWLEAVMAWCH